MKFKIAAAAAALFGATYVAPAQAAVPGYYLANFTYPGGTFNACFTLTQTDTYPGYSSSGTWIDTNEQNTSGTYVVYKKVIHLVGTYGPSNFVAIDGHFAGPVIAGATFDIFTPQGYFLSAGNLTEMRDPACSQPAG